MGESEGAKERKIVKQFTLGMHCGVVASVRWTTGYEVTDLSFNLFFLSLPHYFSLFQFTQTLPPFLLICFIIFSCE